MSGDRKTCAPKVLIVEDETLIALGLESAFSEAGFIPVSAGSVKCALKLCDRHDFAAAVLDWRLPDGDPSPVVTRLQRSATGVIVLTGENADRVAATRGVTILCKPCPMDALIKAVRAQMAAYAIA